MLLENGGPRAMLWRIHTHAIDLLTFFADAEPEWVWAELEPGMQDYGTEYKGDGGRDASKEPGANAYITYRNGVRAYLTGWKRNPQDYVVHLIGTEGRIELDVEGWRVVQTPVERQPDAGRRAREPDLDRDQAEVHLRRDGVRDPRAAAGARDGRADVLDR